MRRGTRVGQAYIAVTADGDGINEDIVDAVDDAGPGVEKSGDEHGKRYGNRFSQAFRDRLDGMRDKVASKLREQMSDAGTAAGEGFSKNFEHHFDSDFLDRIGEKAGHSLVESLNKSMSGSDGENPLSRLFDRWMDEAVSGNGRSGGGRGGEGRKAGIAALIGSMFGAGSRNNFLNVIGKSLENIVGLTEKVAGGFGKLFTTFFKGASQAEEGASLLQKAMSGFSEVGTGAMGGISKAFSSLAASGPALVVALVAVGAAMSIMASVVGALLGLVTALAATIAAALTGAVLVLGGAIAAVAAGAGLLTAAFMSMTDAQKKLLTDAFKPLKAEMVGIGQIMLKDMVPAFATWSANLQAALMQAVPVAQVMGAAFAEAGNRLTASFSGPGFQMFANSLGVYLPAIVTRLASALGSFLNGLLGLFSGLMPYVNQFSKYLANVAAEFSAWATSAQGQNAIADFVGRAIESLQSLWGFVSSFSSFLGDVLFSPEAMGAGNTIFDSMAKKFQQFSDVVARARANGDLQRWFNDAIQFGSQLWSVIESLGGTFMALYNSGVITGIGQGLAGLSRVIGFVNGMISLSTDQFGRAFPVALAAMLGPINAVIGALTAVGNAASWALERIGLVSKAQAQATAAGAFSAAQGLIPGGGSSFTMPKMPKMPTISMPQVQSMGNTALGATGIKSGGYKKPKQYHNPYTKWANSLIKQGPGVSAQIKNAMLSLNKSAAEGIRDAARSTGGADGVVSAMESLFDSLKTGGEQVVNTARTALNNAATSLANATSKGAAKAALKKVKAAQKDLRAALADQKGINAVANTIATQKIVRDWNVNLLLGGAIRFNTTLAEFAEARSILADRIDEANQKLADAISMRDDYNKQVAESIRTFGALASAQAKTVDGVEMALTADDITSNLQDRLDKIRKFQTDLQLLLAQGLSNDAYKQIVDEGVTGGTVLADALLAGGNGAIQQTNSLVGQINGIAATLGTETSNRLYQAGVDAAQGLVDGLTSLSAQLDSAAAKLGDSIAAAVKRSLGIKSPSTVLRAMMGFVGDGAVLGLEDQHVKVGSAASALANLIAVNPGGPPATGGPPVSGNGQGQLLGDLHIHTPTEDPRAVANEAINELVGRLP